MIDRYRNYKPLKQATPAKTSWRGWPVLCLVLAITCVWMYFWRDNSTTTLSKRVDTEKSANVTQKSVVQVEPIASDDLSAMQQRIDAIINENSSIDIAVTIIDISTNTKVNHGIQEEFVAASTTKVLTAAAFLNQVEHGNQNLTPESKELIKQMINQSNNEAWYTLNKRVTYTNLNKYAASIQISSYDASENVITASDAALLLQKLYQRELLNEEHTTLLLSYMQNTNNESMIPKATPVGATIFHKYGQLEDRLHDIAIIDFQNRPLAVAIYTKGGTDTAANYTSRTALVQSLAQAVFEGVYKMEPAVQ